MGAVEVVGGQSRNLKMHSWGSILTSWLLSCATGDIFPNFSVPEFPYL